MRPEQSDHEAQRGSIASGCIPRNREQTEKSKNEEKAANAAGCLRNSKRG